MKKFIITTLATAILLAMPIAINAQSKVEKRYAYTLKNLKLDKATETKFAPILKAYLKEKKEAGDIYDDVKDKYKSAVQAGTITDKQATLLLDAKVKELEVRKKYTDEFKKVLKPKKVYYALDLANEKISKIDGRE